jgi:hypothetical protein
MFHTHVKQHATSEITTVALAHKSNLANNTAGGGAKLTGVLGTLFYKGVKFQRREIGTIKRKFFIFFFVYFLSLFNSVTKKIFVC